MICDVCGEPEDFTKCPRHPCDCGECDCEPLVVYPVGFTAVATPEPGKRFVRVEDTKGHPWTECEDGTWRTVITTPLTSRDITAYVVDA